MPENRFDKRKVQRCPETTHRILLGFSLACNHQITMDVTFDYCAWHNSYYFHITLRHAL